MRNLVTRWSVVVTVINGQLKCIYLHHNLQLLPAEDKSRTEYWPKEIRNSILFVFFTTFVPENIKYI